MNESVVRKAEGIAAILGCVPSSVNDTIIIDESDLRDLIGNSEAAFFVEERMKDVSGMETAVTNVFDKLCSVAEDEKPKKLIFKLMSGEKMSLMDIMKINKLVISKCADDAHVLWGHESSSDLGEEVRITILIPAAR